MNAHINSTHYLSDSNRNAPSSTSSTPIHHPNSSDQIPANLERAGRLHGCTADLVTWPLAVCATSTRRHRLAADGLHCRPEGELTADGLHCRLLVSWSGAVAPGGLPPAVSTRQGVATGQPPT